MMEDRSQFPGRVQLQSMDDFMREGDVREAAELASRPKVEPPPAKKQKKILDQDVLNAEANAVREMGDTNWIGKLNGNVFSLINSNLTTNPVTQNIAVFTHQQLEPA